MAAPAAAAAAAPAPAPTPPIVPKAKKGANECFHNCSAVSLMAIVIITGLCYGEILSPTAAAATTLALYTASAIAIGQHLFRLSPNSDLESKTRANAVASLIMEYVVSATFCILALTGVIPELAVGAVLLTFSGIDLVQHCLRMDHTTT